MSASGRTPKRILAVIAVLTVAAGWAPTAAFGGTATPIVTSGNSRLPNRAEVVADAARYGQERGYHVGVAVYDRTTGQTYAAGSASGQFATESVVKVFIATRLLVEGRMYGSTAATAYKMITQSDDASANALYGRVGGDALINWVKGYFHEPDLGAAPSHAGWWGNTHVTPLGMVRVYAKLAADNRVGPWLLNAMHHASEYGSDGTYQYFGLRSANSHAATKQGWGCDYTSGCAEADFNSTGFVDRDRYAIALLVRGPPSSYGSRVSTVLTAMARTILPNGVLPPTAPTIARLSTTRAASRGGTKIAIHGRDLATATGVSFGRILVRTFTIRSSRTITLRAPRHAAGLPHVRVHTRYGTSALTATARIRFIDPPVLSHMSSRATGTAGGERITVRGHHLVDVRSVRIGSVRGLSVHVLSPYTLTFVTPPHTAGQPHVRIVTKYGTSTLSQGRFRYVVAPLRHP